MYYIMVKVWGMQYNIVKLYLKDVMVKLNTGHYITIFQVIAIEIWFKVALYQQLLNSVL